MNQENKNKVISAGTTIGILLLALIVCAFVGLMPPDPPIPEEGVEVNLGDSDTGLGSATEPAESDNRSATYASGKVSEDIAHQSTEQTDQIDVTHNPQTISNTDREVEEVTEQQPTINPNALFKRRSTQTGGSEGVTQGSGNQGKEGGNPNSTRYDGTPGHGGSGWSLEGRGLVGSKPQISYDANEQGKNVVKIWVDRNGKVVRAEPNQRGSTITKPYFANKAKEAALQFHFTEKEDAGELQIGYVTCVFSNVN